MAAGATATASQFLGSSGPISPSRTSSVESWRWCQYRQWCPEAGSRVAAASSSDCGEWFYPWFWLWLSLTFSSPLSDPRISLYSNSRNDSKLLDKFLFSLNQPEFISVACNWELWWIKTSTFFNVRRATSRLQISITQPVLFLWQPCEVWFYAHLTDEEAEAKWG